MKRIEGEKKFPRFKKTFMIIERFKDETRLEENESEAATAEGNLASSRFSLDKTEMVVKAFLLFL